MNNFDEKILDLISETESNIYSVERMIFASRYPFLDKELQMLSKQSIVMLYSLWEGFVQEIFRFFLEEIGKLGVNFLELKDRFMVSQIEKNFKQFNAYPQKPDKKAKFHRQYFEMLNEEKHEFKLEVDTKNNVGLEILNELLDIHGMEKIPKGREYWQNKGYMLPDNLTVDKLFEKLLMIRNNTAHGNKIVTDVVIKHAEFEQYKRLVINIMYEVGELICDCIKHKKFLKENN